MMRDRGGTCGPPLQVGKCGCGVTSVAPGLLGRLCGGSGYSLLVGDASVGGARFGGWANFCDGLMTGQGWTEKEAELLHKCIVRWAWGGDAVRVVVHMELSAVGRLRGGIRMRLRVMVLGSRAPGQSRYRACTRRVFITYMLL
jgi:hypothetical protein